MNTLGIIASVIATIAAILTLCYTVGMSKGNIRRRIEKKKRMINEIDNQLYRTYRTNSTFGRALTSLDIKKEKLQHEIKELEKEL